MKALRIRNDWLDGARRVASPNYDARPPGMVVDTLVIHGISLPPGRFGHGCIDALFTNRLDVRAHPFFAELDGLRVSAHVLIARTGTLTQYVGFDRRAWHAGASYFAGRQRVNDFSVGVELEGTDDCPYTPAQYRVLAGLVHALMHRYPGMTRTRIVGHSDIAPGRKTDPGPAFDWDVFDHYCLKYPADPQNKTVRK
jgi:AmpD protein